MAGHGIFQTSSSTSLLRWIIVVVGVILMGNWDKMGDGAAAEILFGINDDGTGDWFQLPEGWLDQCNNVPDMFNDKISFVFFEGEKEVNCVRLFADGNCHGATVDISRSGPTDFGHDLATIFNDVTSSYSRCI